MRQIVSASSLQGTVGRAWWLLLVVPETDFVGFVATNNRRTLLLSGSVVVLAVALSGFLAYQGYVSDRIGRELSQRKQELAGQSAAYAELAEVGDLFDPADNTALRRVTEIATEATGARAASLWLLDHGRGQLVCVDSYDAEARGHTASAEILISQCPGFLAPLLAGETLSIADTMADPRSGELYLAYLHAVGCRTLLSTPVRSRGEVLGCIWIEDGPVGGEREGDAV